jgi:hypothetical protein
MEPTGSPLTMQERMQRPRAMKEMAARPAKRTRRVRFMKVETRDGALPTYTAAAGNFG